MVLLDKSKLILIVMQRHNVCQSIPLTHSWKHRPDVSQELTAFSSRRGRKCLSISQLCYCTSNVGFGARTVVMSKAAEDDHAIILLRLLICLGSCNVLGPGLLLLLDGRVAFVVNVLEEGVGSLEVEVLKGGWSHLSALN